MGVVLLLLALLHATPAGPDAGTIAASSAASRPGAVHAQLQQLVVRAGQPPGAWQGSSRAGRARVVWRWRRRRRRRCCCCCCCCWLHKPPRHPRASMQLLQPCCAAATGPGHAASSISTTQSSHDLQQAADHVLLLLLARSTLVLLPALLLLASRVWLLLLLLLLGQQQRLRSRHVRSMQAEAVVCGDGSRAVGCERVKCDP
jgi:hypothetical protein